MIALAFAAITILLAITVVIIIIMAYSRPYLIEKNYNEFALSTKLLRRDVGIVMYKDNIAFWSARASTIRRAGAFLSIPARVVQDATMMEVHAKVLGLFLMTYYLPVSAARRPPVR